jgi:uncharacterized membrane protein (UPF0127 family)
MFTTLNIELNQDKTKDIMFKNYRKTRMLIKGRTYRLWVADTEAKKRKGLRGILGLPRHHGMIFVYDKPVKHDFTMMGVKIPLTIIFLNKAFQIVDIKKAKPGQRRVEPSKEYCYVIEI